MIQTQSKPSNYRTVFTNGTLQGEADAPIPKGGQGLGFGPHELLEASLAACINMWIRMEANRLGISPGNVSVSVTLDRSDPAEATFLYLIILDDALPAPDREVLLQLAGDCPVKRTLQKKLSFQSKSP